MKKIVVVSILLTSCFSGCASYVNPNNEIEVSKNIKIETDNYRKIMAYSAPVISHTNYKNSNQGFIMLQAGKRLKTGEVSYQITLRNHTFHWYFLNTAHDSEGNQLPVQKIKSDVRCMSSVCSHFEDVNIKVSRHYLEQHQENGLMFQVSGKNGSAEYKIPSAYIKAFLAKVPF